MTPDNQQKKRDILGDPKVYIISKYIYFRYIRVYVYK